MFIARRPPKLRRSGMRSHARIEPVHRAAPCRSYGAWLCFCAAVLVAAAEPGLRASNVVSIAEFQRTVPEHGRTIQSFRIEGVVCAIIRERKLVALQDNSATVLLELPAIESGIGTGEWLVCVAGGSGHCDRTGFEIRNAGGEHRAGFQWPD